MINPITKQTYESIVSRWIAIIKAKENGIDIWPPISGAYVRVRQFLADKHVQTKNLPADIQLHLIHTEGFNNSSYDELDKQFGLNLGVINNISFSLQEWLKEQNGYVVFFITGLDLYLKNGDTLALNYLNTLSRQHRNLSIIILTGTNIFETIHNHILLEYSFFQNCFYQPLYRQEDSLQMLSDLEVEWQYTISQQMKKELAKRIGGHFFLLKAAARMLRDNKELPIDILLQSPSLKRKGIAIFEGLTKEDQKIVLQFLKGNHPQPSEYLEQTEILRNEILGIFYWNEIKQDILSLYDSSSRNFYSLDIYLTSIEREVFDILLEQKDIISRERIAQTLWRNEWQERYSDWAIDQTIHRIREKLEKVQAPYEIVTKKGEGFILVNK